jgi:hypothetical protein
LGLGLVSGEERTQQAVVDQVASGKGTAVSGCGRARAFGFE